MRIEEAQGLWRPERLYLNTASYGLPPTPAWNTLQAVLEGATAAAVAPHVSAG